MEFLTKSRFSIVQVATVIIGGCLFSQGYFGLGLFVVGLSALMHAIVEASKG